MAKDPAVLFYTNDFLSGTFTMSDEQVGKYIRLLCLQHQKYELNEKDMLNICKTYDEDIYSKFLAKDGKYFNERMREETDRRRLYSESRKNNRKSTKDKNISKTYVKHMETENETENETVIKEERTVSSSDDPTIEEVISYFESCGFDKTHAQNFFSHYSAQNWETSGFNSRSIKARWRNKVMQWMNNQKQYNTPKILSKYTAIEEKHYDQNKRRNNDLEFKKKIEKNEAKIAEQGLYDPTKDPELQKLIGTKKMFTEKPVSKVKEIDKNSIEYKRKLSLLNQQIDNELRKEA